MKKRHQMSRIRSRKSGFTLIETMLAVSISIMVFFAMGMVLSKCFSLWKDATANWQLAQYARITRARILSGGFNDPSGGLLSATNVSIVRTSYALNVGYATQTNFYGVCGYTNISQPRIYLLDQRDITPYWDGGYDNWAWGIRAGNSMPIPETELETMTASISNDIVTISYRLRLSAAGKTFVLPHTIQACLVNKE